MLNKIRKNGLIRLFKIYARRFISRLRGLLFGIFNTSDRLPRGLCVGPGVRSTVRYMEIGENVTIGEMCSFGGLGKVILSNNVVLNRNVHINASELVVIGENTLIGPDCYFVDSNHVFKKDSTLISSDVISSPILLKDNVWLGRNVTVLPGVTIERNVVVAACAVVTKSIPENTIAKGVPAKFSRIG